MEVFDGEAGLGEGGHDLAETVLPLVHGAGDNIPAGVRWLVALEEEFIMEVAVGRADVSRVGLFEDAHDWVPV